MPHKPGMSEYLQRVIIGLKRQLSKERASKGRAWKKNQELREKVKKLETIIGDVK